MGEQFVCESDLCVSVGLAESCLFVGELFVCVRDLSDCQTAVCSFV